jgi:hypothetical protein
MLKMHPSSQQGPRGPQSRRSARRRAVVGIPALAVAIFALLFAAPAFAGLKHDFSVFYDCPINDPNAAACLVSTTNSGEFVIGSKTVPINKTVTLQGATSETSNQLIPAVDGNTLSKTPLTLPGGLVGIELGGTTEVTATAELAGPVVLELQNLGTNSPAIHLPVKVKLDNPALGTSCYIGSNSEQVALALTTGTTSPPPPNKPITGSKGGVESFDHSKIIAVTGASLVDNSFSAPGVNGCGGALAPVVDPVVNVDAGLPAAAGKNTAILNSGFVTATPRAIKAQAALPEIGRCVKVAFTKEGKEKIYHGHYEAKDCREENPLPPASVNGQYEWLPGAGANSTFTTSSAKTTLATVGGTAITCSHSTGSGEYTGQKTATATITLTGCQVAASKQACQSSGAGAGEIVTSPLAGELGFIEDFYEGEDLHVSVGLDLKHAPTLLTAECGSEALSVAGSVIAPISSVDKMTPNFTVKFKAAGGKQLPEAFEEEPNDTLSSTLGGGSPEQAGLTSAGKIANGEKLEIKAATE